MDATRLEQRHDLAGTDSATLELVSAYGNRRTLGGRFRIFGGRWLVLSTHERIVPSTAVSVEYTDVLFIGEVVASKLAGDGRWTVQIRVEHTLTNLESLMSLHAVLLESHSASVYQDQSLPARFAAGTNS